jgi:hypothetical protein
METEIAANTADLCRQSAHVTSSSDDAVVSVTL